MQSINNNLLSHLREARGPTVFAIVVRISCVLCVCPRVAATNEIFIVVFRLNSADSFFATVRLSASVFFVYSKFRLPHKRR